MVGCSLFIKNALNFNGIKSCASFTDRSPKQLELMVIGIGKSTPRSHLFRGKMTHLNNFLKILYNFQLLPP